MSNIIKAHIYPIHVKYYDFIQDKETSGTLINPYTCTGEYIPIHKVKDKCISENTFSKMINGMLNKEFYKHRAYTVESFKFIDYDIKYLGEERWWLSWFAHHTYSKFESEREIFKDFEEFLIEKGVSINWSGELRYNNNTGYCAMGGEDRYRWELCKCDGCLKQGITTIIH